MVLKFGVTAKRCIAELWYIVHQLVHNVILTVQVDQSTVITRCPW